MDFDFILEHIKLLIPGFEIIFPEEEDN